MMNGRVRPSTRAEPPLQPQDGLLPEAAPGVVVLQRLDRRWRIRLGTAGPYILALESRDLFSRYSYEGAKPEATELAVTDQLADYSFGALPSIGQ
jgi:hypothetical protein